ncbi:hypothetical protein CCY99_00130 [Helicobacter sp. 16-1353]|uniref:autotransporter outer membrane beta-barrel domain-containing protein n=1 Tax=Helicobacter sp. 16-1353 TaxID=2004996 RepID=UPI000DCD16EF|nr:autotransporter outer membrane beta-barrel domain-containing protein [Helicobacter sp. 16-1353]RAX55142.1 hypothetical protein CCY99_00130 [Helicobacter sp. 16-1353]
MYGLLISSTATSVKTLNNYNSIYGNNGLEIHASIATLNNHGTMSVLQNLNTLSTLDNYGTIGEIENFRELTTLINRGKITGDIYNVDGQTITTLDNTRDGIIGQIHNRGTINTLTNSGKISGYDFGIVEGTIGIVNYRKIAAINNYGTISGTYAGIENDGEGTIFVINNSGAISKIVNSGTIKNIYNQAGGTIAGIENGGTITTLNNQGRISLSEYNGKIAHIHHIRGTITISNYHLQINERANTFNAFNGYNAVSDDISHLVIGGGGSADGVKLKDSNSKILISFGANFELNKDYSLSKLIFDADTGAAYGLTYASGTSVTNLYSHLQLADSVDSAKYEIQQGSSADYFKIVDKTNPSGGVSSGNVTPANIGSSVNVANISNVNMLASNVKSNIFKNAFSGMSGNLANVDSIDSIRFKNLEALRIARLKENLSKNLESKDLDSFKSNDRFYYTPTDLSIDSSLSDVDSHNYRFFFTPFITHSIINANNVSGLSYGFVSGFNARLGDSHTLGTHIGFSYGNLKGSNTNESIESTNLNALLGLHYKLDLVYRMYVKALIDAVFINNNANYVISNTANKADSNSLGYNLNIAFGKDFDFESAGIFGAEIGLNSLGLNSSDIIIGSQTFKAQFTNLIYVDLGVNYDIKFGLGIGLDSTLGLKYLLNSPTGNIQIQNGGIQAYDIGADKFIAYFGLGINYAVTSNIELGLNYLGNFGDESIQNSGFFNVKIGW